MDELRPWSSNKGGKAKIESLRKMIIFVGSRDSNVCLGNDFLTSSTNFVLGTDYNFECREDGIMLTSSTAQFLLTDRAENVPEQCKEISHWNKYGGSMFIPDCLTIKEDTKIW